MYLFSLTNSHKATITEDEEKQQIFYLFIKMDPVN